MRSLRPGSGSSTWTHQVSQSRSEACGQAVAQKSVADRRGQGGTPQRPRNLEHSWDFPRQAATDRSVPPAACRIFARVSSVAKPCTHVVQVPQSPVSASWELSVTNPPRLRIVSDGISG